MLAFFALSLPQTAYTFIYSLKLGLGPVHCFPQSCKFVTLPNTFKMAKHKKSMKKNGPALTSCAAFGLARIVIVSAFTRQVSLKAKWNLTEITTSCFSWASQC